MLWGWPGSQELEQRQQATAEEGQASVGVENKSIALILEQLILKFYCTDCSSASYLEVIQNKSQMSSHISP